MTGPARRSTSFPRVAALAFLAGIVVVPLLDFLLDNGREVLLALLGFSAGAALAITAWPLVLQWLGSKSSTRRR